MMAASKGLSERIREVAYRRYVLPAIESGKVAFSLRVRDLMEDLRQEGVSPDQRTPQFCTAIQKPAFLRDSGLEIESVDGPPKKLSTTVVVNYRVLPGARRANVETTAAVVTPESPAERAFRLTEKLRGLMKDEIAAHGGTEGFLRWVRSDEDVA